MDTDKTHLESYLNLTQSLFAALEQGAWDEAGRLLQERETVLAQMNPQGDETSTWPPEVGDLIEAIRRLDAQNQRLVGEHMKQQALSIASLTESKKAVSELRGLAQQSRRPIVDVKL